MFAVDSYLRKADLLSSFLCTVKSNIYALAIDTIGLVIIDLHSFLIDKVMDMYTTYPVL